MNITIFGDHTALYGVSPYEIDREIDREFEDALKENWTAVEYFSCTSNSTAEICINPSAVADMTVRAVYARLTEAVKAASIRVDWDIWRVEELS